MTNTVQMTTIHITDDILDGVHELLTRILVNDGLTQSQLAEYGDPNTKLYKIYMTTNMLLRNSGFLCTWSAIDQKYRWKSITLQQLIDTLTRTEEEIH